MLHPFISAANVQRSVGPSLALSTSLHVGLICFAVWTTGMTRPARLIEKPVERVRFADLPPVAPARPPRAGGRRAPRKMVQVQNAFELPPLPSFEYEPEMPPLVEFEARHANFATGDKAELTSGDFGPGVGDNPIQWLGTGKHDAYDESSVDRLAFAARGNRRPRYPYRMRARGVEANFVVYFVIDTSGIVDRATVELPGQVEPEFTAAVTEVLADWRFVPALLSGRRVRQQRVQPFVFEMEKRYSSMRRW